MSTDTHYLVTDPLAEGGAVPMPTAPERGDDDPFVTGLGPAPPAPPASKAPSLEEIICALRKLVLPTREINPDDWSAWTVNLTDSVMLVANRHPGRRRLLVKNNAAGGGANAWVGPRLSFNQVVGGFRVEPGATVTLDTGGPVYAVADAGTTLTLNLLATFDTAVTDPF